MKRVLSLLIAICLVGTAPAGARTPGGAEEAGIPEPAAPEDDILEELKLFNLALGAILEGYVGDVEARKLFYEAVRGMLKSLDKYSEFFEPERYELLKIDMKGEYAGIGAWLQLADGQVAIEGVKPGSVAEKAGLLVDDRILKIDGLSLEGRAITDVAALLRGEPGTQVLLALFRPATGKSFEMNLVREKIELEAVRDVRRVGRAIGYMNITDFRENTVEQVDRAIEELTKDGAEAFVLDLRGNAGGLMDQAVELAERFLPEGKKIVSVSSKIDVQRKEYFSSGKHTLKPVPVVILVNGGSASASEIFSAAMQDHKRATVIGTQSFGKASVQSVVPLDEVSAMKLTTARYVSPLGRVIDEVGIAPDEVVEDGPSQGPDSQHQIKRALEILREFHG